MSSQERGEGYWQWNIKMFDALPVRTCRRKIVRQESFPLTHRSSWSVSSIHVIYSLRFSGWKCFIYNPNPAPHHTPPAGHCTHHQLNIDRKYFPHHWLSCCDELWILGTKGGGAMWFKMGTKRSQAPRPKVINPWLSDHRWVSPSWRCFFYFFLKNCFFFHWFVMTPPPTPPPHHQELCSFV